MFGLFLLYLSMCVHCRHDVDCLLTHSGIIQSRETSGVYTARGRIMNAQPECQWLIYLLLLAYDNAD
jgi:hypothetical protein